ncbi:MAG: PilZ domain-containing protein [Acidobacteria bacterium]|nr:PilZ domain-containing protein [Acidobacteriota bacterium]
MSISEPVQMNFRLEGRTYPYIYASVHDISVGGAGVVLAIPQNVPEGQYVTDGRLVLPEIEPISFEGYIKWRHNRRVGIEFIRMPESIGRLIFQFVIRREREMIKEAARNNLQPSSYC